MTDYTSQFEECLGVKPELQKLREKYLAYPIDIYHAEVKDKVLDIEVRDTSAGRFCVKVNDRVRYVSNILDDTLSFLESFIENEL